MSGNCKDKMGAIAAILVRFNTSVTELGTSLTMENYATLAYGALSDIDAIQKSADGGDPLGPPPPPPPQTP